MNKQKLLSWLKSPETLSAQDLKKLEDLQKEFPYFSLAYALHAKVKYQEKEPGAKGSLGKAALYTADRHRLKQLVMGQAATASMPKKENPVEKSESAPNTQKPSSSAPTTVANQASTVSRKEETPQRTPSVASPPQPTGNIEAQETIATQKPSPQTKQAPKEHKETLATNEEVSPIRRIVFNENDVSTTGLDETVYEEIESSLQSLKAQKTAVSMWIKLHDGNPTFYTPEEETVDPIPNLIKKGKDEAETPTPEPPKEEESKKTEGNVEHEFGAISEEQEKEIWEEINSREATAVDDTWQEEQSDLIDRFLKSDLIGKRPKPIASEEAPQNDLSIKSQEFGDNIISENLAQILAKQGKVDKAIDIYRKLVWKFPQKKAYFAALIEKLKESQ